MSCIRIRTLCEIQEGGHAQRKILLKLDTCMESKWNRDLLGLVFDLSRVVRKLVSIDPKHAGFGNCKIEQPVRLRYLYILVFINNYYHKLHYAYCGVLKLNKHVAL